MAMVEGGMPSMAILPPWFILSIMSWKAEGTPDISSPTSNPSVMPSSLITSESCSLATLTARVAPILRASSSRYSLTSVITTWRAPTWRQTAAAMMPIGPAPVMSTSSPTRSKERAVCTALPNGSKMAARSSGMLSGSLKALKAGITRYSAKEPGRLTPTPMVLRQRWVRPARQLRQWPQVMWPSPETLSPTAKPRTSWPTATTSPTYSWPTTMGTGMVFWDHSSQL